MEKRKEDLSFVTSCFFLLRQPLGYLLLQLFCEERVVGQWGCERDAALCELEAGGEDCASAKTHLSGS